MKSKATSRSLNYREVFYKKSLTFPVPYYVLAHSTLSILCVDDCPATQKRAQKTRADAATLDAEPLDAGSERACAQAYALQTCILPPVFVGHWAERQGILG